MVTEELGELLDVFAKKQRDRVHEDAVAEEAADTILVAIHACATEGIPPEQLWKHLINKLGRTKQRVGHATRRQRQDADRFDGEGSSSD